MFSQAVIEKLGYYVYTLQDPRDNKVFYIGKGMGNRVFNHLDCALETYDQTEKLNTIREIVDSGNNVIHFILRHGLTEDTAFEIEAAMIDFVGRNNLSNIQGGHYSNDFGIKTADEIKAMYEASDLETDEPIVLININRQYRRDMTDRELYDATRISWVIGTRREKAKYVIATYGGLTREVYEIDQWFSVDAGGKTRWAFDGKKASETMRETLMYKSISHLFPRGAANPIKYLNC